MAREKARERGIEAEFEVGDAFELGHLGRSFETVLDCGLFHTLDGEERALYVASLESVTGPGATLHLLCFSDADPDASGPHPVSEDELRAAFESGGDWRVESVEPSQIEMRLGPGSAPAWLAAIKRIQRPESRGD
jgi:hypothetical protein